MAAGEIGQMVIQSTPTEKRFDRPGCVEELISNAGICDRYSAFCGGKRASTSGDTFARVRRIAELSKAGDSPARQTLDETARYLGIAISNVVWGFDADTIVIDAAFAEAWGLIEPVLWRQLPDDNELWGARNLRVRPSSLGGEAALIGSATLPLNLIFAGASPAQKTQAAR